MTESPTPLASGGCAADRRTRRRDTPLSVRASAPWRRPHCRARSGGPRSGPPLSAAGRSAVSAPPDSFWSPLSCPGQRHDVSLDPLGQSRPRRHDRLQVSVRWSFFRFCCTGFRTAFFQFAAFLRLFCGCSGPLPPIPLIRIPVFYAVSRVFVRRCVTLRRGAHGLLRRSFRERVCGCSVRERCLALYNGLARLGNRGGRTHLGSVGESVCGGTMVSRGSVDEMFFVGIHEARSRPSMPSHAPGRVRNGRDRHAGNVALAG